MKHRKPFYVIIAIAVFLEHGGSGSANAGPVAMEVLERYFREILSDRPTP